MRKTQPLVTTRTPEPARAELPLAVPAVPPASTLPGRRPADRIKEALLRWLEEEM